MSVTASKDGKSFTISEQDSSVEIARAMAELSRRWGHPGEISSLIRDFQRIIQLAKADPKVRSDEIILLEQRAQKLQLLEDLARSFRAMEDEDDELKPRFQGTLPDALEALKSYGYAVGAKLEITTGE